MPPKVIPRGMMQDFKKELSELKRQGRLDKSVHTIRQQLYMRMATRFGQAFMRKNDLAIRGELDAAVKEVKGG